MDEARNQSQVQVGFGGYGDSRMAGHGAGTTRQDRNRLIFGSIVTGGFETTSHTSSARGLAVPTHGLLSHLNSHERLEEAAVSKEVPGKGTEAKP